MRLSIDGCDTSDLHYGKYNCGMAVYLDYLAMDGGEDEWTGDSDLGESTLRFGKWLLSYDDRGFIEAYKYESINAARREFERINAAFVDYAYAEGGDDDGHEQETF